MRCVYCDEETGTDYDEHEACVEESMEQAVPGAAPASAQSFRSKRFPAPVTV